MGSISKLSKRYHAEVGFPQQMEQPVPGMFLWYTHHAWQEARDDRGHLEWLPLRLPSTYVLVEATMVGPVVASWLVRVPTPGSPWDVVLAIRPDGMVRTVWANNTYDTHRTLDTSLYDKPEART